MSVSPVSAGFSCRCPRCGRGRLFSGYLKVADKCESCGLDLAAMDSGDGPAVFVMFIVLIITVPLMFVVWAVFEPPVWVHAILWPIVVTGLSLWLLRPAKGAMLGLQFKHKAGEHRVGEHGVGDHGA